MDSADPLPALIARKRDGGALSPEEIGRVIGGAVAGEVPDYQLSALLMAIVFRGLGPAELAAWLEAMVASGDRLQLEGAPGPTVDKHSTGGVGDKISICLAPLVAACGAAVPMISGRALGHSGGTLDKLEAIPGFRTALSPDDFSRVLGACGLVLAGQSDRLAPADRLLYALRDATGTVESIPLIASSILSKKIAEGTGALVMDVKVGRGAFMKTPAVARTLARTIVALGRRAGLRMRALLTAMDEPIGRQVGNACETREAIEVLRGEGPPDTRALTTRLGGEMLALARVVRDRREGERRIEAAITSGAGLERLRRCVELQGGDPRVIDDPALLPRARREHTIVAARTGVVVRLDAGLVGRGATVLGAGRQRKDDRIDPGVGITLHRKEGESVKRGEPVMTLCYEDEGRLGPARALLEGACAIGRRAHNRRRLVLEEIR